MPCSPSFQAPFWCSSYQRGVLLRLEWWHPEDSLRWTATPIVEVEPGPDSPVPVLPGVQVLAPHCGPDGWVLRFRQDAEHVVAMLCSASPPCEGQWEAAIQPDTVCPWAKPHWRRELGAWLERVAGPHRAEQKRVWGRSTIWRIEVGGETLWLKQSYDMPPGEAQAMLLASRHDGPLTVPKVIACEGSRTLMFPLRGQPLRGRTPLDWAVALRAVVAFQKDAILADWANAGVRDLRGSSWHSRISDLLRSYGFDLVHAERLAEPLDRMPFGLLPQDLGPCNIQWIDESTIEAYDWADVVISHPLIVIHRFLNEATSDAQRSAILDAVGDPEGYAALAPVAPAHEAWRYHQELDFLDADDPFAGWLRAGNHRTLRRLLAQ